MTKLLHIDASARADGSNTRKLSARFVARWRAERPCDPLIYRDVGRTPPAPVSAAFIEAAFTRPARRSAAMVSALAESDMLVEELLAADLIIAGVPMYNFGVPAQFKAWIDNVVRVGRTFGFDRSRRHAPYDPLLAGMDKTLVIVSARGDRGYDPGGANAQHNHVEPAIRSAFAFMGIGDVESVATELDEFGDESFRASVAAAERKLDLIADRLLRKARAHSASGLARAARPNGSGGEQAELDESATHDEIL